VQVWNVTRSGQADMPYCELRFPQSPCQLLLTGLAGDLPAPAMLSFGTYLAWFAPGNALNFGIGRRGQFSAATVAVLLALAKYLKARGAPQLGATLDTLGTEVADRTGVSDAEG
jgi:hypothetical protein